MVGISGISEVFPRPWIPLVAWRTQHRLKTQDYLSQLLRDHKKRKPKNPTHPFPNASSGPRKALESIPADTGWEARIHHLLQSIAHPQLSSSEISSSSGTLSSLNHFTGAASVGRCKCCPCQQPLKFHAQCGEMLLRLNVAAEKGAGWSDVSGGGKEEPNAGFSARAPWQWHIRCLPDDFADIYSRLCLLLVSARLGGEADATLIHTCIRELWQLRDRISGLIWFCRVLFIGSHLTKRVFKPSTE